MLDTECTTNKPGHCPHGKDSLLTMQTLNEELIAESEVHPGRTLGLCPGEAGIGPVLCGVHLARALAK